jgi:hypothetical protein
MLVFAVLYFQREERVLMLAKAIKNDPVESFVNRQNEDTFNQNIFDFFVSNKDLKDKVVKLEQTITERDEALRQRLEEKANLDSRAEEQDKVAESLRTQLQSHKQSYEELQAQMSQEINARKDDLNAEIARLTDLLATTQGQVEAQINEKARLNEKIETLKKAYHTRILELRSEANDLRRKIDKWEDEAGRRESVATGERYDGKIIQADLENKFVVVDLGKVNHVRRGMRFDVIRWRLNRWDYMGAVELTKVDTTTSQGVILDAIVQNKFCPVTGWVAPEAEMKYSPYAATGAQMTSVVELIKGDLVEKPSMKKLDPIVIGDYITNPFYSRDRQLKFVVTGNTVRYSVEDIKQQITRYGGLVTDRVDVDTDYLVLGFIPEEGDIAAGGAEAKERRADMVKMRDTAKQYGITIMREVELFEFLRN